MFLLPEVIVFLLFSTSLFWAVEARAQATDAAISADDGGVADSDAGAPSLEAPRALSVAPVVWPSELPFPAQGFVELTVLVGRDGLAQFERCTLPAAACDAVSAALVESEFAPALIGGIPSSARVGVRFPLRPGAPTEQAQPPAPASPSPGPKPALPNPTSASDEEYGAQAVVTRPEPTLHSVSLEQIREVPGAFGDPFRVIEALPGVVPVMSGVPYVYVRGAPPSATAYFYDDIQMPVLFHLGLGPAVVHPAMVGSIDFYPGVAPTRYGRKTGGTVAGKAAFRPLKPGLHGELELRQVDMQAYLAKPFGKRGRIEIGGRYGYPGLMIKLFDSQAVVQYWDYQLRSVIPLSPTTEASVIALGSFDLVGSRSDGHVQRQMEIQFHRLDARLVERRGEREFGAALTGGIERSGLADEFNVSAYRLGSKLWFSTPVKSSRLRIGADMLATSGRIQNPLTDNYRDDPKAQPIANRNPAYQSATGRNVFGAYGELRMPLGSHFEFDGGLRGDLWLTGSDVQYALEPRGVLRWFTTDTLTLHAAAGLAYQPAVFLIPLPGISDVALDRGLQRAIQTEVGAQLELPASFRIESKVFVHLYNDMLSIDGLDIGDVRCTNVTETMETQPHPQVAHSCDEQDDGLSRLSARSYGSEWLIRRDYAESLSGWLSYTLAKADGHTDDGQRLVPNFDVRHVANLVFQWRITPRWHVSLRGYVQSGRFPLGAAAAADPRQRERLPAFYRGDLNISRIWQRKWGELRAGLDWLNFTFQREPLSWHCDFNKPQGYPCEVEYVSFPITLPVIGVRGSY